MERFLFSSSPFASYSAMTALAGFGLRTSGNSAEPAARHKDRSEPSWRVRAAGTVICAAMLVQFIRFLTGFNLHRNGSGSKPNCVSQTSTTTIRVLNRTTHWLRWPTNWLRSNCIGNILYLDLVLSTIKYYFWQLTTSGDWLLIVQLTYWPLVVHC